MLEVACIDQLPVAAARRGELEAWDALFQRYQMPLYVYVRELVHDEQTSLDIVQETFVNALRHLESLRDDAKFGSWLFRIAHQKSIQHWRRQARETWLGAEELDRVADPEERPDEVLLRKEQEAEFMKLLEDLPAAHRSVLLLHYLEDFSLEEIAAITATNLGTVKSRMHYAKKSLRKLWTQSL
jgi:RNA polymerase sigma-70 factor (ECF subfamily)